MLVDWSILVGQLSSFEHIGLLRISAERERLAFLSVAFKLDKDAESDWPGYVLNFK